MKIAVLSDIHSNLPALETVLAHIDAWAPDQVVVGGDVINRGPSPAACWETILSRVRHDGWHLLKGNHEDYVLVFRDVKAPRGGPRFGISRHAYFTFQRLRPYLAQMAALPDEVKLTGPAGGEIRIVHGSMLGNRQGIFERMSDAELLERMAPAPAVFVGGHTHRAFARRVAATLAVNSGSVGLPFDGDWRAGYAQLSHTAAAGWGARIIRLEYDRAATDRAFATSGFLDEGGPLARIMRVELRLARSLIFGWVEGYQEAVLAETMSLERSVDLYLADVLAAA